jgi:4-amino-4-deoxy-L-arabinose transferase-like glycosyltransferase
MSNRQSVGGQRAFYIYAAALLLGVLFIQVITSISRLSITFDEDLHIAPGYTLLRTGDLRLIEEHPPLIEAWVGWPLLFSSQVPNPWDVPAWRTGDQRLFVRNEIWWRIPIDSWVIPCRIPVSWLALLLGAFLFRWASDWFGPPAGLFALALLTFDPNILAHATVATVDLGTTCFIFIAMYGLQRFLTRPSTLNLIVAGIALGLALAAKISSLILLPISGGLLLLWMMRTFDRRHRRSDLIAWPLVYLGAAFLTLWASHLFEFGRPPGLSFPVPAPSYWRVFRRVAGHVSGGDWTYLLGETYRGGRWYFFPVVFALKTPLPTFVFLGMALVAAWRRPQRGWRELVLTSLPVSYFVASVFSAINLGYRHLLPILPFLYLFIARLAGSGRPRRAGRPAQGRVSFQWSVILVLLLLWQAVGALRTWPFYLTFFNEITGGPRNGYRYLADSNVDWGQGLKALRAYLEARSWPDVRVSSFTFFIRPELYGVQATPLHPLADAPAVLPARFNPAAGTYVISASTLRGLQLVDPEMYNWFWHREPDDVVANAMLVYQVSERVPRPTWLAQCEVPIIPLSPEAVVDGFGRADLRMLAFDCTQSWIYPDAGESAGWYILHRETVVKEDDFIRQQLTPTRLSFEQKIPRVTPPLTIFEWHPLAMSSPQGERPLWAAPAEWPPAQAMDEGVPLSTPVSLAGPLTFLGYELSREERMNTLITYWQVVDRSDRPFSLMAHLVSGEGRPVAVGDGLGVPWEQLQPGDLLVQRHLLSAPQELSAGSYWLQTGAYWLDTMERWKVGGEGAGDRILLTSVEFP